jgi:hypothetical protein
MMDHPGSELPTATEARKKRARTPMTRMRASVWVLRRSLRDHRAEFRAGSPACLTLLPMLDQQIVRAQFDTASESVLLKEWME